LRRDQACDRAPEEESTMAMMAALLAELEHESATTRKLLERVPEERLSWSPHRKSMTLGRLTQHLAEIPGWGKSVLAEDALDIATMPPPDPAGARSRKELLELHDRSVATFAAHAKGVDDARLMAPWRFLQAGQVLFEMLRLLVVRTLIPSHLIHHRGQLSVYLRQLDVALPGVYGPSADDPGM
jgi:uncharacterized damage-inducible protein DinB